MTKDPAHNPNSSISETNRVFDFSFLAASENDKLFVECNATSCGELTLARLLRAKLLKNGRTLL